MAKILVIDDEFAILESVADLLVDEGFTVETANNGAEGLRVAERFYPDVVLTDQMMPTMSGSTFITELRARADFKNTPVVLMSALPRHVLKDVSKDVIVLSKPFQIDQLLEILDKVLGK